MTTDAKQIPPALSAEDIEGDVAAWAAANADTGVEWLRTMALANYLMPDTSPYRITRKDVAWLQSVIDRTEATACGCRTCQVIRSGAGAYPLRDKLAALLPPEA